MFTVVILITMEQSKEQDLQVALFLEGLKDQVNLDSLTQIDTLLTDFFEQEEDFGQEED